MLIRFFFFTFFCLLPSSSWSSSPIGFFHARDDIDTRRSLYSASYLAVKHRHVFILFYYFFPIPCRCLNGIHIRSKFIIYLFQLNKLNGIYLPLFGGHAIITVYRSFRMANVANTFVEH